MTRRIKIISILIISTFLTNCEKRDWDNPFDPDCPKELFTPENFKAVQEDSIISLSWDQANMHISGFTIERSLDSINWTNWITLSKSETTASDDNITGGQTYSYRLTAQAGGNPSNSLETTCTPAFASSVTTLPVSSLATTSVVLGGNISNDGGAEVTSRGVCWNTNPNPTIQNSKTTDGTGTGTFESTLSGLTANTTYYARAYSTNSKGTSYGNQIVFKTYYGQVTDIDGNVYFTVQIGEQIWMAENLKVTKYNDGTIIPNVTNNSIWDTTTTGGYRWYGNNIEVNEKWGAMYNWYAIGSGKLAPEGWHVASDDDWKKLEMTLGMTQIEVDNIEWRGSVDLSNQLKASWGWGDYYGTNTTSFSALPGGYAAKDGSFGVGGLYGGWWTSTETGNSIAINRQLSFSLAGVGRSENADKATGLSVRCILGEVSVPEIQTYEASNILGTSAILGGLVLTQGNSSPSDFGLVYSTSPNPTISDSKVSVGTGTDGYEVQVSGLETNTQYYVRAYLTNESGTYYGDEKTFTTFYGEVTDIDGNVYPTVKIGDQIWMAENLKVIRYNDGTDISNVTDDTQWANSTTGAYCWYNNDASMKEVHGALYNWYAVSTNKLAPTGWHIPTEEEWNALADYLGGLEVAGGKLKEIGTEHWQSPNTGATNESGFTALGSGDRYPTNGMFVYYYQHGSWWTSTKYNESNVTHIGLMYDIKSLYKSNGGQFNAGYSVRCVLGEIQTSPSVSTSDPSNISTNSAVLGGNVTNDGNATVTERGIVYSINQNPTTADTKIVMGSGIGSFADTVKGLTANTTYYVRAYAINSEGTAYGNETNFTTSNNSSLASLSLNEVSGITSTNAFISFNITDDGGSTITERGICYSTSANPTVDDTKVAEGSGTGYFGKTFTGFSPNTTYFVRAYAINSQGAAYSNEVSFKTFYGEVTDIDGNIYLTVQIGDQIWMAENLKVTSYNDGSSIPNVTGVSEWSNLTIGAYCWNNNEISNKEIFGGLYNWHALNSGKLAPEGWHIPTDEEWNILINYLGGSSVAGGKMKTITGWDSPNEGATNSSGFSALQGGSRREDGNFFNEGYGYWWSRTEVNDPTAYMRSLAWGVAAVGRTNAYKTNGYSIRCIFGEDLTPEIATNNASEVLDHSAVLGGEVSGIESSTVSEKGLVYSTGQFPTTDNLKISMGIGTGDFSIKVTGLTPSRTYYVRAYAINGQGVFYGNEISFTTSEESTFGTFIDERDSHEYNWAKIGGQIWMAENLAYLPFVSSPSEMSYTIPNYYVYAYTDTILVDAKSTVNFSNYGVLYNWAASLDACPLGWHLPTDSEWEDLAIFISTDIGPFTKTNDDWNDVGMHLKAIEGWNGNIDGTDDYGFSGLPGGYYDRNGGVFRGIHDTGRWWSATESSSTLANDRLLNYGNMIYWRYSSPKDGGYSIRCIKD